MDQPPSVNVTRPSLTYQPDAPPRDREFSMGSTSYDPEKEEQELSPTEVHTNTARQPQAQAQMMGMGMGMLQPPPTQNPMDWNVPNPGPRQGLNTVNGGSYYNKPLPKTVSERLSDVLTTASTSLTTYETRAKNIGLALNVAVGLQVLLGALITGVAAAASPHGAQISTTLLGGMSTLVASGLARGRGSGEPEVSLGRARDLSKLVRNIKDTILDWGDERPTVDDPNPDERSKILLATIDGYRKEYDDLVSQWNGEKTVGNPVEKV